MVTSIAHGATEAIMQTPIRMALSTDPQGQRHHAFKLPLGTRDIQLRIMVLTLRSPKQGKPY
jgi:hypothetical protein